MIMLTLPPSTSLSVTDAQNNTAPDRKKYNRLKRGKKINLQYLDITTRRQEDITHFGIA